MTQYIVIDAPANSGSLHFNNYKETFSIYTVLLIFVDANYRFITMDVGSYRRK